MAFALGVLLYLFIEILFYTFHVSILILLIARRNSKFKGPFYNILRIVFVADVMSFLTTVTIQKVSFIPIFMTFFKENSFFAILCYNFATSWPVIQFTAHSLMALNRFTLIWIPLKHQSLWKRQWYFLVIICVPFLLIIWRIDISALFVFIGESSVTVNLVDLKIQSFAYSLLTATYLFTTFVAAVFNGLAFLKFYFYKQALSSIIVKEKHLLFMSFVAMITQLLRTSYNIQRMYFPADEGMTVFFNSAYPMICDIFALSGSLSLFILSAITRREYIIFYFSKAVSHIVIVSSHTKIQIQPAPRS